jgi:hypothetical protein
MQKLEKRLTIHRKKSESMTLNKQKTHLLLGKRVNVKITWGVICGFNKDIF